MDIIEEVISGKSVDEAIRGAEEERRKARRTPLKKKHLKKRMGQPVNFAENSTKNSSILIN